MTDEIDEAQERQRLETEAIVRDVSERVRGAGCSDCDDCGHEIDPERRAAYPAARTCVRCQRRRERKVP